MDRDSFLGCGCMLVTVVFIIGLAVLLVKGYKKLPVEEPIVLLPVPEDTLILDFGDENTINFKLCDTGDLLLVKKLDGTGRTIVPMDTPFYIMETELTIGMYKKLKELSPELPEIAEFNKNCNEKNVGDNKPLHGIIPFEKRNTPEALVFAEQICSALNAAYAKYGRAGKEVNITEGFRIPTDKEWQYACRATTDCNEAKNYIYFGKLEGRNLDSAETWYEILNNNQRNLAAKGGDGLENKYKSYMEKYWHDIWNRDFCASTGEEFEGKPEQLLKIYLARDSVCKKPIPRENIQEIVDSIPQTLLFYYLYDSPRCKAPLFLYSTEFCPVKITEVPNVWGLYDMHGNASEIVRYDDSYRVKGGSFNTTLPNEWMKYSIGYVEDISLLNKENFKHAMPGIRLVISVKPISHDSM